MLSKQFRNPIVHFLLKILALYLLWYVVYDLWLHPQQTIDLFVIDLTIKISKSILELMNYNVFTGVDRLIGVDGTGGLWIGDRCNGIALFGLFSCFIIAYPGNWVTKIIYIPIGIICIEIINIIRIIVLAILDTHSRALTEFNHTYTFTIIVYGFIFFLWMLWVNSFSGKKEELNTER
jgi:exosortase family protein XrtF